MRTTNQLCSVPVCKRKHFSNGYCEAHNKEYKRHGTVQNREPKERLPKANKIYTRMSPEISEKFQKLAKARGVKPYTLARDVIQDFAEGRLKKAGGRR